MVNHRQNPEGTSRDMLEECWPIFKNWTVCHKGLFLRALDESVKAPRKKTFKEALIDHAAEFGLDPESFQSYPCGDAEALSQSLKSTESQP